MSGDTAEAHRRRSRASYERLRQDPEWVERYRARKRDAKRRLSERRRPRVLRCDCGEAFALDPKALVAHAFETHGRAPTRTERTPR